MARRSRQQSDEVDLGSILQLYSMFSPEAQAKTQILQQQAQLAPQLNQAQIDAMRAEIAERTARAGASTEQTRLMAPSAESEVAYRNAQTAYQNEATRVFGPRQQAEISALNAGTAKTGAETNAINLQIPGQVALTLAGVDRANAETGLTQAQTTQVAPNAEAQRKSLSADTTAKYASITPLLQGRGMQGAIMKIISDMVPGMGPEMQAINEKDRATLAALVQSTIASKGVDAARVAFPTADESMFTVAPGAPTNSDPTIAGLEKQVIGDQVNHLGGALSAAQGQLARVLQSNIPKKTKLEQAKLAQARVALLESELRKLGGAPANTEYRTEDFGLNQSPLDLLRSLFR